MRRTLLVPALLAWALPLGAAAQTPDTVVLSLSRAEALALEHHPILDQARVDLQLAQARRSAARHSRFLPQLSLSNVWGPIPDARGAYTDAGVLVSPDTVDALGRLGFFTETNLELLQPLYTFGRIDGLVDAADAGVAASRAGIEATSDEVRLQVRKLYWGMALGEELVRVADEVMSQIADADPQLQERYDEGTITQNDLFRFEVYRYRAKSERREVVDRLELARAALRAATGLPDDVPIRAEGPGLAPVPMEPASLADYLAIARDSRPELSRLQAGIAAQMSLASSRRSEYYPQLFLAGSVKWNYAPGRFDSRNPFVYNPTNFFRPGVVVGFNWNVNLFQTRDRVRIAEREAARLSAQLEPLSEKVELDVRQAYRALMRAAADVEDSQVAFTAAENWFRAESQTFDLGIGEVKDLVDAFQAKIEMETEHLRSTFEFNSALADLSRAVGRDLVPN